MPRFLQRDLVVSWLASIHSIVQVSFWPLFLPVNLVRFDMTSNCASLVSLS